MSRSVVHLDAPVLVREKLFVLGLINTLQPVKFRDLRRALPKRLNQDKLRKVLKMLRNGKFVHRFRQGEYLATLDGRTVLGLDPLASQRDVARMLHLSQRSKGGREGK